MTKPASPGATAPSPLIVERTARQQPLNVLIHASRKPPRIAKFCRQPQPSANNAVASVQPQVAENHGSCRRFGRTVQSFTPKQPAKSRPKRVVLAGNGQRDLPFHHAIWLVLSCKTTRLARRYVPFRVSKRRISQSRAPFLSRYFVQLRFPFSVSQENGVLKTTPSRGCVKKCSCQRKPSPHHSPQRRGGNLHSTCQPVRSPFLPFYLFTFLLLPAL